MDLGLNQNHEKIENYEIEIESLALRFESFHSQKLEYPTSSYPSSSIQRGIDFI
jgi:hypothetical protein